MNATLSRSVSSHWFYLVAPFIIAADLFVALDSRGETGLVIEACLLFDLAVVIPSIHWLCYRRQGKKSIVSAIALSCLGMWAALRLVPEPERELLNYVEPLRYVGIVLLTCLEIAVLVAIYRAVFKGAFEQDTTTKAQAFVDLPLWLVRLFVFEAMLWRKVWLFLKGLLGKK